NREEFRRGSCNLSSWPIRGRPIHSLDIAGTGGGDRYVCAESFRLFLHRWPELSRPSTMALLARRGAQPAGAATDDSILGHAAKTGPNALSAAVARAAAARRAGRTWHARTDSTHSRRRDR